MKTPAEKKKFLEALRENHIVLAACRKMNVSKTTYYRWRQEDSAFAIEADLAIREGIEMVNDAAESNIITEIKNRDKDASKFWLKHRHPAYATKVQIENKPPEDPTTPEEDAAIARIEEMINASPDADITNSIEEHHDEQSSKESAEGTGGVDAQPETAPGGDKA